MSAAVSASNSNASSTDNSTPSVAVTTPAVGELIVVVCHVNGTTNTSFTCTDDQGGTYTAFQAGNPISTSVFAAFVRTSLVSSTSTHNVSLSATTNTSWVVGYMRITGMSRVGSDAVRAQGSVVQLPAPGPPSVTLNQTTLSSNLTFGFLATNSSTPAITPTTGFTEDFDTGTTVPNTGVELQHENSGFASNTLTWGSTLGGGTFGALAIELDTTISPAFLEWVPKFEDVLPSHAPRLNRRALIAAIQQSQAFDPLPRTVPTPWLEPMPGALPNFRLPRYDRNPRGDVVTPQRAPARSFTESGTVSVTCSATATVKVQAQSAGVITVSSTSSVQRKNQYAWPQQQGLSGDNDPLGEFDLDIE